MNSPDVVKMLTPDNLDRRTYLKGITLGAGAVVLQPFVNALAAEAAGETPPPRFIFLFEPNGLAQHHIQPQGIEYLGGYRNSAADKLIDLSLSDHELAEPLAPLAPFKGRMTILQGLSHRVSGGGDHGKRYGAMGCFHWRKGVAGQTIDHALAESLPGVIPVVGLAVNPSPEAVVVNTVSAAGPKRPHPMICQPDVAFQTLFGSVAEGNTGKVFQARNKLLDWIRSDIKRVQSELPAMDREKLDMYLDTFEQMRTRQDKVAAMKDRLKANAPVIDRFNSKLTTERFEAQCDIAAAALASRLTSVVTIDTSCGMYHRWPELGIGIDGHSIGHMGGTPEQEQYSVPIRKFYAERIATLAKKLDSIKEGNGTVLDNTLIVYMSDSGEDHHGSCEIWPTVLVGNLGGRLKTAGRHLQFPKYKGAGHHTMTNFYLSLLHAVGDQRERFGDSDPELADIDTSGPLAEILA